MTTLVHKPLSTAHCHELLDDAAVGPPQAVGVLICGRGGDTVYVNRDDEHYFVSAGQWDRLRAAGLDFVLYAGL